MMTRNNFIDNHQDPIEMARSLIKTTLMISTIKIASMMWSFMAKITNQLV